ncbi:tRNA (guanine-N(7)-)-methyltransferase [Fonsecaea nubica]|uniref:tRNA (guanine-N(7)-)-methyltransferase n=1 Tax=Fonsecaea nubica TaxID=856822 RepID=A0A178BX27_9EURO|nr:tRNA (guanine-N(7)-)-methyltransferase [Fonsecaea nubica]OAL21887.1 tRNA (guanine-N(7)-)-methyltransferase [Fonsecaea nubica]
MTGPANKRQKREDYKRAQESLRAGSDGATGGGKIELPKKKFYRQRAHANPFSDHALTYPTSPADMDWTRHYPAFAIGQTQDGKHGGAMTREVEVADIGCGFGGLLVALSPLLSETLMLGMELRSQVTDYVVDRIAALRTQNQTLSGTSDSRVGLYQNISALRTNTMKFLPNYFHSAQLSKIFLCFPDPHFKQRKHKARIVSAQLNAEYAFVTKPGGLVYTITDVEELHHWMVKHFDGEEAGDARDLWKRVSQDDLDSDPCVKVMSEETEESKKVTRNGGRKFVAVFQRKEDPEWPD